MKYGTDIYGNVYTAKAQIEPKGKTKIFNPEMESLDIPPACPAGKRPKAKNGIWSIIDIPAENILDNGIIRPKNQVERIQSGIDQMPVGKKIVDSIIIDKTPDEKLADGEITVLEYNVLMNIPINEQIKYLCLESISDSLDFIVTLKDCPDSIKYYNTKVKEEKLKLKGSKK